MKERKKQNDLENLFFEDHLTEEAIALFADALVLDKVDCLPLSMQNHVKECKTCKKEILAVHEIVKCNEESIALERHPYFSENKMGHTKPLMSKTNKTFILAATVSIIVSVLFWLVQPKHDKQTDHIIISEKSKAKNNSDVPNKIENKAVDSNKDSKSAQITYNTYPLFENMIASNYRSNDMKVIEPSLNQQYSSNQPVSFKFKGDFSNPLELLVFNNEGKKLYTKDINKTPIYKLPVNLKPGLYYWKLLSNDDLLCISKFIVN